MTFIVPILSIILLSTPSQISRVVPIDSGSELMVQAIFASTTIEWRAAFAERGGVYDPPRIVFLRPPPGHPSRGAGYSRQVGLVIDLGDTEAVLDAFPQDGASLVALMVAHEVGHHVQALLGDDPEVAGAARERQADCLAGWWIVKANARADRNRSAHPWPLINISSGLPEILRLLDTLQSGRSDGGAANRDTHGPVKERVKAFEQGMSAVTPWICLWGSNP